jgi:hypothetical protein
MKILQKFFTSEYKDSAIQEIDPKEAMQIVTSFGCPGPNFTLEESFIVPEVLSVEYLEASIRIEMNDWKINSVSSYSTKRLGFDLCFKKNKDCLVVVTFQDEGKTKIIVIRKKPNTR